MIAVETVLFLRGLRCPPDDCGPFPVVWRRSQSPITEYVPDPELPAKARNGQLETLSPCIGCLLGCVPNMFAGKAITCAVNPCVGRESELAPAA